MLIGKDMSGKIYCIKSPQTELVYYGSTFRKLSKRLIEHKSRCKRSEAGVDCRFMSSLIVKYDDCYIELVGEYHEITKEELAKYEREHILADNKACNQKCPRLDTDGSKLRQRRYVLRKKARPS